MTGRSLLATRRWLTLLTISCALAMDRQGRADRPSGTESREPTTAELAERATDAFATGDTSYRSFLVSGLASPNPYMRKLALERLLELPALVDPQIVTALVPRLEETIVLAPVWCVGVAPLAVPRDDTDEPQGVALTLAECARLPRVSNGSLAAKILQGKHAFAPIIQHVARRPRSTDAVLASLGAAGIGPASQVIAALSSTTAPDAQRALLRLTIAGSCDDRAWPEAAKRVAVLNESPNVAVNGMASLAILRLVDCRPSDPQLGELRKRAARSLEARLRDLRDEEVVAQTAWLGAAARGFVESLLARFGRLPENRKERAAIVGIFADVGPGARSATPALIGVLQDRRQRELWIPALAALGAIGPSAAEAKGVILVVLRASSSLLLHPVARTLQQIDAKLTQEEFSLLSGPYRAECDSSLRMPTVGVNEGCSELSIRLARLAKRGSLPFQPLD